MAKRLKTITKTKLRSRNRNNGNERIGAKPTIDKVQLSG